MLIRTRQSIPRSITISDPSSSNPIKFRPIFPVSATPHLPTVTDVLRNISELDVISVQLKAEHVEALLDLMIYDGQVEKILVNRDAANFGAPAAGDSSSKKNKASDSKGKGKARAGSSSSKRRKASSDSSDSDSESDTAGRRKGSSSKKKASSSKRGANGKARKKRAKLASDDDGASSTSESESEDFDSDEEAPSKRKKRKGAASDDDDDSEGGGAKKSSKRRKKRGAARRVKRSSSDPDADTSSESDDGGKAGGKKGSASRGGDEDDDDEDAAAEGAAQTGTQYVYRLVRSYAPTIGWTDMPCGKCPVEDFCSEPPRQRAVAYRRPPGIAANPTNPNAVRPSLATSAGAPKLRVELEGGIEGVGMLGGAGAAIGVSEAKWGEMKGAVGAGIAPVNPRDCPYFAAWVNF